MCEYCEGEEARPIVFHQANRRDRIEAYIEPGKIGSSHPALRIEAFVDAHGMIAESFIDYCPMCKRDLRGGDHD